MTDQLPTTIYLVQVTHPETADRHHRGTQVLTPAYYLQDSAQAAAEEWNTRAQAKGSGRTYHVQPVQMTM
ncbi:hypothetical protein ACQHIV_42285 (plasmid) [Kribbella sp. GL6]|uniref:hypothetical protein n=1 Tax=Kribbella sp. GL6 TaxID=3419765 RepID=UPI003CFCE114